MSAIDFDMTTERLPDPKGDRVKIGLSGKFLPFKYYRATGNQQAYGYKNESTAVPRFRAPLSLVPAKAGTQRKKILDSRLRGNEEKARAD